MSTPKVRGGSWLSNNYDKLALLVVLALILVSSIILFVLLDSKRRTIEESTWDQSPAQPAAVGSINTGLVASVSARLAHPLQVPPDRRRLAVGDLRVACVPNGHPIAYEATNCPFCNSPQEVENDTRDSDGDGIPDKVELQYGLNPLEPSDAEADADGDKFSNVEEIRSSTDPKDEKSKPDAVTKVRVSKTMIDPFKLRFLGVSKLPDGERYQLNMRSLEKTYFARMGEVIEGFKVSSVDFKEPKKPALILLQGTKPLRLVQGEIINEDSYSAILVCLTDLQQAKIAKGANYKLQGQDYKVVDIRRDAVVIRDAKEGRETTVPMLTENERLLLQGNSVAPENARRTGAPSAGAGVNPVPADFPFN